MKIFYFLTLILKSYTLLDPIIYQVVIINYIAKYI